MKTCAIIKSMHDIMKTAKHKHINRFLKTEFRNNIDLNYLLASGPC